MKAKFKRTTAIQKVQAEPGGTWAAWYECCICGDVFAESREDCKNEETAREESDKKADGQIRKFCRCCGIGMGVRDITPDKERIIVLTGVIAGLCDDLREKDEKIFALNRKPDKIKLLENKFRDEKINLEDEVYRLKNKIDFLVSKHGLGNEHMENECDDDDAGDDTTFKTQMEIPL